MEGERVQMKKGRFVVVDVHVIIALIMAVEKNGSILHLNTPCKGEKKPPLTLQTKCF